MAKPAEFSDEVVKEKTGKSSEEWYKLIDDAKCKIIDHTAIAKLLKKEYDLSGWWAQAITNRYEHKRGLRQD
jgi:hypothetical protein